MTFRWKDKAKLFSGEGIYFLTFVVVNRKRMFGRLFFFSHGMSREVTDFSFTRLPLTSVTCCVKKKDSQSRDINLPWTSVTFRVKKKESQIS